jgi:hypothetical protein
MPSITLVYESQMYCSGIHTFVYRMYTTYMYVQFFNWMLSFPDAEVYEK